LKVPTAFRGAQTIVRVQRLPEKPVLEHLRLANPYWLVDIQLARKPNGGHEVRGTIHNRSGRRQLPPSFEVRALEIAGAATFRIRDKALGDRVREKALEAGEKGEFREDVPWTAPRQIASVRQALKWDDAPVKRVDRLEIGPTAHEQSDRTSALLPVSQLKEYPFSRKAPPGTVAAAPPATPAPPAAPGVPGGVQPPVPFSDAGGATPPGGQPGTIVVRRSAVHGVELSRYYQVSTETTMVPVRRIPVATVLIVDPAHINDVLAAFANSRLRIQTTLTAWHRVMAIEKPRWAADTAIRPESDPRTLTEISKLPAAASKTPDPSKRPTPKQESTLVELQVYGLATIYENPEAEEKRGPGGQADVPVAGGG
jgi:hypothetical protein